VSPDLPDGVGRAENQDNSDSDHNDNDYSKVAIVGGLLRAGSNTLSWLSTAETVRGNGHKTELFLILIE
jgi:hypothetical protein